jgi:uncharacterized protein (DUF1015 family)
MIRVYPFSAIMPPAELAAKIACEPYDVISTSEARERAAGNEHSFLHVVRSEIDLPPDTDVYDPQVYATAAANLNAFQQRGWLQEHTTPGIYIYRQTLNGRHQHGVVCTCDAEQYRQDLIKKHEKTRPDKEDDRTRHMTVCSAHAEPVFLTFRDHPEITVAMQTDVSGEPLIDFTAVDGIRHTIWATRDPSRYVNAFAQVPALYIADGHHRTAGGERAAAERQRNNPRHTGQEEYNRILSVIFPASELCIMAYNRVVHDLNGQTPTSFLDKLRTIGSVVPTANPEPKCAGSVCIFVDNQWYLFTFTPESIPHGDPIESLDVALLQQRILAPLLGVGDPRTDKRIGFVGGMRGTRELEHLVRSGDAAVAFSMYPTSIQQLLAVSDAGAIMPPKSTWFEPKLRSGLFVHRFES